MTIPCDEPTPKVDCARCGKGALTSLRVEHDIYALCLDCYKAIVDPIRGKSVRSVRSLWADYWSDSRDSPLDKIDPEKMDGLSARIESEMMDD